MVFGCWRGRRKQQMPSKAQHSESIGTQRSQNKSKRSRSQKPKSQSKISCKTEVKLESNDRRTGGRRGSVCKRSSGFWVLAGRKERGGVSFCYHISGERVKASEDSSVNTHTSFRNMPHQTDTLYTHIKLLHSPRHAQYTAITMDR